MRTSTKTLLGIAVLLIAAGCRPLGKAGTTTRSAPKRMEMQGEPHSKPETLGKEPVREETGKVFLFEVNQDTLDATAMDQIWAAPLPGQTVRNAWWLKGLIFIETNSHRLYCMSPEAGHVRWVYKLRSPTDARPTYTKAKIVKSEGVDTIAESAKVYVVAENIIHCLDAETGFALWRSRPKMLIASPLYVDENIYCGGWDYGFYKLHKEDDYWKWRVGSLGTVCSQGYYSTGVGYFASEDGNVYAYNPLAKEDVWFFETRGPIRADLLVENDVLYVGSCGFSVYALDLKTGRKQWRFRCEGSVKQDMLLSEKAIYATADDDGLYAIEKEEGAMKWFVPDGKTLAGLTKKTAYIGLADNSLCAVERASGKILWKDYDDLFDGFIATSGSEVVFAVARQNQIVALKPIPEPMTVVAKAPAEEVEEPGETVEPVVEEPGTPELLSNPVAMLPADIDAVAKINVSKLLAAPIIKEAAGGLTEGATSELQKIGLDPKKDIDSAYAGLKLQGQVPQVFAVLTGSFDPDAIATGIADLEDAQIQDTSEYKGCKIIVLGGGPAGSPPPCIGLLSKETLLLAAKPADVEAMVDLATGKGGASALQNQELADVSNSFNAPAAVWLALVANDMVKEKLAQNPMMMPLLQADAMLLSVDFPGEEIHVSLTAGAKNPDGASALASFFNASKGMIGQMMADPEGNPTPQAIALMEALKVSSEGNNTTINLTITNDMIEQFKQMFMGGMMGGPGPGNMGMEPPKIEMNEMPDEPEIIIEEP